VLQLVSFTLGECGETRFLKVVVHDAIMKFEIQNGISIRGIKIVFIANMSEISLFNKQISQSGSDIASLLVCECQWIRGNVCRKLEADFLDEPFHGL